MLKNNLRQGRLRSVHSIFESSNYLKLPFRKKLYCDLKLYKIVTLFIAFKKTAVNANSSLFCQSSIVSENV